MNKQNFVLFTRTPLHVGAGASVGAIDQPVQRERHTGFPIIPGSGLKGAFADQWPTTRDSKNQLVRLTTRGEKTEGERKKVVPKEVTETAWLFGSDTTDLSFAGALLFSEARLLAFPIRSARGSYGWVTSPTLLARACDTGLFEEAAEALAELKSMEEPEDGKAIFCIANASRLALPGDKIVLEEYCFQHTGTYPTKLARAIAGLIPGDFVLGKLADRLVVLSDGLMSHFATTACEVAQHVRINDETGTADDGGLFNQENVPADTLFYTVVRGEKSRVPQGGNHQGKSAKEALEVFAAKVSETRTFQFGGDSSTGLGFTSVVPVSAPTPAS